MVRKGYLVCPLCEWRREIQPKEEVDGRVLGEIIPGCKMCGHPLDRVDMEV